MIIGIDIDDTITDTYEVIMGYAQEYTINNLNREPILKNADCTNHMYTKVLHDWKTDEDLEFLKLYYEKMIKEVKPKTLAVKYLKKLHEEGHKIVLITARWEAEYFDLIKTTEEWLKENDVSYDKLIVNAENKLIACKDEKVDLFIDDSISNCNLVSSGGIKTYIMDSRTNKNMDNEKIERIYSWPHLYFKISKNSI